MRAYEIYRRLSERHLITVVCGKYPGAVDYDEGNLRYRFVGTGRNNYLLSTFGYACAAASFLLQEAGKADVVIEDFAPYNPLFSFPAGRNVVIQVHQKEGFRHLKKYGILGLPFLLIESFYPKLFSQYITISEMSRKKFGLRGRGVVIANGFDAVLLDEENEEKDFVLSLGRLHIDQKGLDTLQEAWKSVPARLCVAGSGKDEAKVRRLFAENIHSKTAEMVGFVRDKKKRALLRSCRFLVLPSRYEGQPLILAEAAACGKPVIVSDIPELKYAVEAGFGLSFRVEDSTDLAEKIKLLLESEPTRAEMGRKAREYAKNFTWEKVAGQYEDFLLSVAHKEATGKK